MRTTVVSTLAGQCCRLCGGIGLFARLTTEYANEMMLQKKGFVLRGSLTWFDVEGRNATLLIEMQATPERACEP